MDEKQLKLLLVFGSDAAKVQEDMKRIQSRAEELQKRVQVLRETMKLHSAVGKDITEVEKELQEVTDELVELDQKARQAQTALRGMVNGLRLPCDGAVRSMALRMALISLSLRGLISL
jgi:seryl-tRNA synthetase